MLRIQSVTFDAREPRAIAAFWEQALGWERTYDADDEVALEPSEGDGVEHGVAGIVFVQTPDDKVVKNRLHLDIRPDDQSAEVARLEALGARRVDIGQGDVTWIVLADPDGNEFCILSAERPTE